ncbi:MAG TPA: RsmD family RNA methyltransferase [Candidatus Binatia bacterium]
MAESNAKNAFTLEIGSLSHGPYGIGRHDGRVIMVAGTVPGDRVTAHLIESKGSYAIAELIDITQPSVHRRRPPCPYVGPCGGCPWQQIDYGAQLTAKQQSLEDALRRIGKLKDFDILPIVAAPREFHYRRRIRLRCNDRRQVGFSRSFSHDLVEIDTCEVASEQVNRALEHVRSWVKEAATNIVGIEIVAGDGENELVLVAIAAGPLASSDSATISKLLDGGAGLRGVIVTGCGRRQVWGDTRISVATETDLRLAVEADVFTQVNSEGNRAILHHLLRAGEFAEKDRVLELYCGAGNFALSIARRAGTVVAVEGRRHAVESAKLNAQQNGIENIRWRVAPVPAALAQLARRKERFSKIVLDPPRAGAKGIDRDLAVLDAETILYISCDPATLARDLAALAQRGYKLQTVQPIDLFPQTFHMEALAVVKRQ